MRSWRLVVADGPMADFHESSKPGRLAFGELSGPRLNAGDRLIERDLAGKVLKHFAIADPLAGTGPRGLGNREEARTSSMRPSAKIPRTRWLIRSWSQSRGLLQREDADFRRRRAARARPEVRGADGRSPR